MNSEDIYFEVPMSLTNVRITIAALERWEKQLTPYGQFSSLCRSARAPLEAAANNVDKLIEREGDDA